MAEDIIDDALDTAVAEVEGIFPPKPGGLVDRHRQERARREAAQRERENIDQRIEAPSFKAVKVAQQAPENFNASTYTIAAGGSAAVLPLGMYRNRAVLIVATAGASVVIAKDQGQAIGGNGFTLPAGLQLTLTTRAQVWAFNPGGSVVQVSVIAETYAPEKRP